MIGTVLIQILEIFKYALFLRLIIDYVRMFARNWRPNSLLISIFEVIYLVTDPPMKFVGRFVPPLRLGGISIDLSFVVLLIAIGLAQRLVALAF